MKIINEKQQLRNKLFQIDDAIKYSSKELNILFKKIKRKKLYGFFAFSTDTYEMLDYKYEMKRSELDLLKEYRVIISNSI